MNSLVQPVSVSGLLVAFVPTVIVVIILYRWALDARTALYAVVRMLIQLLLIGYLLAYFFEADHAGVTMVVLSVMLVAASWIALRPLASRQAHLYAKAFGAIFVGGVFTLALVTQLVLTLEPWYLPRYVLPLAGMIFASAMNSVSLAAERFEAECGRSADYNEARRAALQAALIPIVNSMFAVGLVSLPGMMTGQILAGVSPVAATQYQIVVMTMIFGAAGISASLYLSLVRHHR